MRCLVTGVSGFIGASLAQRLLRAGHQVTGLVNQTPLPIGLRELGAEELRAAPGDDLSGLEVAGFDAIFHLAGIAHHRASSADYLRVNVDLTLRLAQLALHAGVDHFIYLSSVKADLVTLEHEAADLPTAPISWTYASSKRASELTLMDLFRSASSRLSVVRPALVYDVDAPGHLAWLRQWARWRLPAPPLGGGRSMISREDLSEFLCMLLVKPSENSAQRAVSAGTKAELVHQNIRTLTVTDGEVYSAARIHAAYSAYWGRRPLISALPNIAWRSGLYVLDRMRGLREKDDGTWKKLVGQEVYQARGFEDMAFSPRLSLERVLGVKS